MHEVIQSSSVNHPTVSRSAAVVAETSTAGRRKKSRSPQQASGGKMEQA
jgi:hypothetical protein